MKKSFSLFKNLPATLDTLDTINNCIKITLGPNGKNGISATTKNELKYLTNGSLLIKALEFSESSNNTLLKLIEQGSIKTSTISSDGSTTTLLFTCELLKSSFSFLVNGYNAILLSNGLKKLAYFLLSKVLDYSKPIVEKEELLGLLKTSLGKKVQKELVDILYKSASQLGRDGLIFVEENLSDLNEIEIVQGIELDRGFASSYFINDLKNFEVIYENPYILITNTPITSINQLREIIDYIKETNRPLILIAEEINKDILSTLVLNNIQKKIKIAVIKYTSIKFIQTGILEDLATLTHSNYFVSTLKNEIHRLTIQDLGHAEKVIIKKEKSTFLVSKFSKIITKRRINELNRELLSSETEYEKTLFKTRIARLSGNIIKLKLGKSPSFPIEEQRQRVENSLNTIKSALEEGILPGGGVFYLQVREELKNWAYLNLIGDEIFAMQILVQALFKPFEELMNGRPNFQTSTYEIFESLSQKGYPYGYDLIAKKIVHTLENGLVDSSKSIRAILWNSLSLVSIIITSE
jgi:chaperonin GroEL